MEKYMGFSLKNKFSIGGFYTKYSLSEIIKEPNLELVREGLYYCKKSESTFLFVDLVKVNKPKRFRFNDKFQGEYFHWDSQTTQHINSPKIQEIVNKEVDVHLFCREYPKIKSKTQPFIYCGILDYLEYDEGTSKPVHIIFQSLDYDDETSHEHLLNLYTWSPDKVGRESSDIRDMSDRVSNKRKKSYKKPSKTERKGLVTSRVGQGWYRREILNRWGNMCSVTKCELSKVLISSHIVPWSESNDEEKLDVGNGILLSPNLDSLFDKHMISFKDSGDIIISRSLKTKDLETLGINKDMKLRKVYEDMKPYLKIHRQKSDKKTKFYQ